MSQANVEIVQRVYEAISRGDAESVLAAYDPAGVWDFSESPFRELLRERFYVGHDGIRSFIRERYDDAWAEAADDSLAVSYPGNTSFGATRNSRIDYVWYSRKASYLVLKHAEVYDTRDANGYMPSDHKPLMVQFEVR